jgi:hypothetical protein
VVGDGEAVNSRCYGRRYRQSVIKRAIAIGQSNPKQAAYHTGLADARNGLVKKLNLIIEMSNHQTSRESA